MPSHKSIMPAIKSRVMCLKNQEKNKNLPCVFAKLSLLSIKAAAKATKWIGLKAQNSVIARNLRGGAQCLHSPEERRASWMTLATPNDLPACCMLVTTTLIVMAATNQAGKHKLIV